MCKGSLRFAAACALLAAPCMWCPGASAADEVTIVTPPVTSGDKVTVVQETTPAPAPDTQKVTVVKESNADVRVEHEAVIGFEADDEAATSVIVKTAPPEPRQEVVRVEARPAEDAVWVSGYWRWDADRNTYEWVPGVWRRAIPGLTWQPGHWVKFENGYQWAPGNWVESKVATTTTTTTTVTQPTTTSTTVVDADADRDIDRIIVKQAPPPVRVETQTASPGADYVWIAGHWEYRDGEYTWIGGRWERPASEGMMWVGPRWIRHTDGTYSYVSGHWDYPVESRAYVVSTDLDDENSVRDRDTAQDRAEDQVRERDTNDNDNR